MNLHIQFDKAEKPQVSANGLSAEITIVGQDGERVLLSMMASDVGKLAAELIRLATGGVVNRAKGSTETGMQDAPETLAIAGLDMVTSKKDSSVTIITETLDGRHFHIVFPPPQGAWLRQKLSLHPHGQN